MIDRWRGGKGAVDEGGRGRSNWECYCNGARRRRAGQGDSLSGQGVQLR
jgi:hypothetical protein